MPNHSLVGNVVAKGILNLFNALLPLVVTTYVYRLLGPANVGIADYATTIVGYFTMIGLLGTYNYGIREISAHRTNRLKVIEIFKNLWFINIISNIAMLAVWVTFVQLFITNPVMKTISWILTANIVSQVFYVEWYNEAMEEFSFITIKTILIRSLSVLFIFIFVRQADDIYPYVAITSGVTVLNYLVSYVYARRQIGISTGSLFKDLQPLKYLGPLLIILVLNNTMVFYTMADRTILGYFICKEDVAYMTLGSKIVEMTRTLLLSVVFATLPRLSLYLHEDKHLYQQQVLKIMRLVMFIIIPTGIGMLMLSPELMMLFGGKEYTPAIPVMRLFSIRMIMLGVEAIMYNQIIFLHGRERRLMVYSLLCGLLNVALNFACLGFLNPVVSLGCTFASEILFEILCLRFIHRNLNIRLGLTSKHNLQYLLAALTFIPIIWSVGQLHIGFMGMLVICIPLCATTYFMIMKALRDSCFTMISENIIKLFHKFHK